MDVLEAVDLGDRSMALRVTSEKIGDNEAAVTFELKLKLDEESKSLQLQYAVDFEVTEENNDEFVITDDTMNHSFLQVNAPAIGYPFVRSFVSTLTVNAGYSPHLLPAINFQKMYSDKIARQKADQKVLDV